MVGLAFTMMLSIAGLHHHTTTPITSIEPLRILLVTDTRLVGIIVRRGRVTGVLVQLRHAVHGWRTARVDTYSRSGGAAAVHADGSRVIDGQVAGGVVDDDVWS